MIDKDDVFRAINRRLLATSPTRVQLSTREDDAPQVHAIIGEICRAINNEFDERAQSLAGTLDQLMAYVDDAKRAAGSERVSGEPLAQFITRMLAELHELREEVEGWRREMEVR